MLIADFSRAMENKDYVALSNCFAARCFLFDHCPSAAGKENYHIYGSKAIEMFYHNKFVLGGLSVSDPVIVNERTVNYFCSYGGVIIHVQATIELYDQKTGLIKEMIIRPA